MRILLVSGHKPGHNACKATGANEGDLNVELTKKLHAQLSPYAQVDVYPYERDMYQDNKNGCLKVNLKDYRYIFEVHFNAGGGLGPASSSIAATRAASPWNRPLLTTWRPWALKSGAAMGLCGGMTC